MSEHDGPPMGVDLYTSDGKLRSGSELGAAMVQHLVGLPAGERLNWARRWWPFPPADEPSAPERFYVVYWTEGNYPSGCESFGSIEGAEGWAEGFDDGASHYGAEDAYAVVHGTEDWSYQMSNGAVMAANALVRKAKEAE